MNKSELIDILKGMYDLRGSYSDEQIDEDQYNSYMYLLDNAEDEKEVIRRIVYELDISKPIVARKIAYPFSFNSNIMNWVKSQIKGGQYLCAACGVYHDYSHDNVETELNIDHEPALSTRFNHGEYRDDRAARCASFNDINRLQLMCAHENKSKGGEPYNTEYINEVFIREL